MKLAAIYNIWDDWDLLECSVSNIQPLVDVVIVVASEYSNYGEYSPIPGEWKNRVVKYEPQGRAVMEKETMKRNYGLHLARISGCTHFLTIDSDEFYDPENFLKAKKRFQVEPNLKGLVVPCNCYFAKPTLTIGRDITLVPFIHVLTPTIQHEFNRRYPFAWIKNQIRVDPTRSLNINSGVEYTEDVVMEHYSWVRKDFQKKIRNSTARSNLERSTIVQDLILAKDGEYCNFYKKRLYTVENRFNIPDDYGVFHQDLQSVPPAH